MVAGGATLTSFDGMPGNQGITGHPVGNRGSLRPGSHAGGPWFDPRCAHLVPPLNHAGLRGAEVSGDHLVTTRRTSGFGVSGRSGDHAVEHRDGLTDFAREEVAVAAVDESAAVVVPDALGD